MKQVVIAVTTFAVLVASALNAGAVEKITRKSDAKALNGDVTAVTKDKITVKDGVGKVTEVPSNDIVDIEWGTEPEDMKLGRGPEKARKFTDALTSYNKALKDTKAKGNVLAELEFAIARTTAKQAMSEDPSKADDAVKKLEAFVKARADSYRFYEAIFMLGDLLNAKKDYAGAETQYQKLNAAPFPDYKMAAKNASARASLANNDHAGALTKFEEVAAMKGESPAEAFRRNEAMTGKASVLVAQQKYDDAMKVIDSIIEASSTEEGPVMADAYNLQGDCLQAQDKVKEAILAYLHVPLLFEKEKSANAKALYNLAQLWPKVDQPDRAEQAKRALLDDHADTEWAKKLQ